MRYIERRRHDRAVHNKRLADIAEYAGMPGPYFNESKGRAVNPGRGRVSPYYKKRCNRAVRRNASVPLSGGSYRKQAEFWWEIT